VALQIECVVDGGMDTEEALGGSRRLEPLYLALASSHHLGAPRTIEDARIGAVVVRTLESIPPEATH
jgi:hypothetical protein